MASDDLGPETPGVRCAARESLPVEGLPQEMAHGKLGDHTHPYPLGFYPCKGRLFLPGQGRTNRQLAGNIRAFLDGA